MAWFSLLQPNVALGDETITWHLSPLQNRCFPRCLEVARWWYRKALADTFRPCTPLRWAQAHSQPSGSLGPPMLGVSGSPRMM